MDYLDPEKQRRHSILLLVGYVCIAIAIIISTVVLVYQAYGFGLDKNGIVIQNGIVFFSSQPNPAQIYINGKQAKSTTNTRLTLPADTYNVSLARAGYRDWKRTIVVDGGSVSHYDYPLLLPKSISSTTLATLPAIPSLTTQSPDRRWLLLSTTDAASFRLYDLKNPTKSAVTITLSANLVSKSTSSDKWALDSWADDNQHVLLEHLVDGKNEFILLDRANPDQSLNLSQTLGADPTSITLIDRKYDHYYLYSAADRKLKSASLSAPAPVDFLTNVLAYKSYGSDQVLYFSDAESQPGKVVLKLQNGTRSTLLRSFPASSHYLVDLATYSGTPYVLASASDDGKVYIFKDPISQLANRPKQVIVPMQVLRVDAPDYEAFSSNAQYVLAEHGNQIAVYDLENKNGYNYVQKASLDAPQTHVEWMDGNRLSYVSSSVLQILDYDQQNQRALMPAQSASGAFFAPDYKKVYSLVPTTTGANLLTTALLIPTDQ